MDSPDAFDERRMTIEVLTPAKINLGLEVIRRRGDGYHDIATVLQTVSIFDRLHISPAASTEVRIVDRIIQIEDNLASRAIETALQSGLTQGTYRVDIKKRIPVAAGLGGASADAAAILSALGSDRDSTGNELATLALQLGSDVPFLLQGGAARATGRGEILEPCSSIRGCWIVLASPNIEIDRKTAKLYGALRSSDFSDGGASLRVASALDRGSIPDSADLENAFARPLHELIPELSSLIAHFRQAGAPFVALSGAGPTHYTIVPSLAEATSISVRAACNPPIPLRVLVARPAPSGILVRRQKTHQAASAL
jgi:4-diphosphocytidyl-2-C-methyl-D-erythritol kinase